jgi:hypothetical protein
MRRTVRSWLGTREQQHFDKECRPITTSKENSNLLLLLLFYITLIIYLTAPSIYYSFYFFYCSVYLLLFLFTLLLFILLFLFYIALVIQKNLKLSQPTLQTPNCYQRNKQITQTVSDYAKPSLTHITMASATYTVETHQQVLAAIKSMKPQWRAEIRNALESEGVNVKSKTTTSRPRSKKISAEKKHVCPFDESVCHARRIVEMCHPDTNIAVFRNPNATTHIGCIDFQCRQKINSDGLCSDCLNSKKRVCSELGPLPFGRFNDPRPANPYRVSKGKGRKHEYVWMEDTQNNDDYIDLLNSPDHPPSTRTSKKSSTSSSDDDYDVNWNELVQTDNWFKSIRVPALRKILSQEGQDTKGNKAELVDRVAEYFMPLDDPPADDDDSQEEVEHSEQLEDAEKVEEVEDSEEVEDAEEVEEV